MKIDFSQIVNGLDGKPFMDKDEKPITVKDVAVTALVTPLETDRNEEAAKSFARYELARRIYPGGEIDIEPAEAEQIRTRAMKCYSVALAGPVYAILKG